MLRNCVFLIILNDEEIEDVTSFNEEDKDEMLVVRKRDI